MLTQAFLDTPIIELVNKYCRGNGLDVGCGYRKLPGSVGVDIMAYGAMVNADNDDPHLSQADLCCDVRDLPFKTGSMDYVFSHHCLEHIGEMNVVDKDTALALQEWVRVLKVGGYLLLITPDINHCISPIAKHRGVIEPHGLEPEEVKPILRQLPLRVLRFNRLADDNVFDILARKT